MEAIETVTIGLLCIGILSFLMLVSITMNLSIIKDKLEEMTQVMKVGLDVVEEKEKRE